VLLLPAVKGCGSASVIWFSLDVVEFFDADFEDVLSSLEEP